MRSLLKAATYLLYCNPAASLVLPSSVVEKPAKAADSILEYGTGHAVIPIRMPAKVPLQCFLLQLN